ncbi:histone deacetylase 7-like, partial [Bombina bombina]|uniref:histone deacetylase 7-like n=1 Tax=Bombina bombina TaxID=8345 RepID=UPI00235B2744
MDKSGTLFVKRVTSHNRRPGGKLNAECCRHRKETASTEVTVSFPMSPSHSSVLVTLVSLEDSPIGHTVDLSIPVSTITTQTTHMDFHLVQRFGQRSDTALLTPKQSQQTLFQAISQHQQAEPKIRSLDSPCRNTDHGRQQLNKERPKCAMASPAVKQKLLEKILNKQQIAPDRNNMANHISPVIAYRPPEHIKQEPPQPTVLTNLIHQVAAASGNQPEHYPLRKT